MPSEVVVLTLTAPSREEADALGQLALERRMAACAQVSGPVESRYWWEGQVCHATEWVCTIKTVEARRPALVELLRAAHPYDVPEIVVTTVTAGDPDYLAWVEAESTLEPEGPGS